jgi:hypothetical protein
MPNVAGGNNGNTPAQDRTQLGIAELVNGAVVPNRRVDYLHGLAFEAIGDLLESPFPRILASRLTVTARTTPQVWVFFRSASGQRAAPFQTRASRFAGRAPVTR